MLEAINEDVPVAIIAGLLFARFASGQDDAFTMKVIQPLCGGIAGHTVQDASTNHSEA